MDEAGRRGRHRAGPGADIAGRTDARSVSVSDEPSDAHSDGESHHPGSVVSTDDSCADIFFTADFVSGLRAAIEETRPRRLLVHLRPVTAASSAVPALQRIAGGRTGPPAPFGAYQDPSW